MSHYTKCKTKITDKEILIKALQDMGFTREMIQSHEEAKSLYGYGGDARAEKAEVIIPRRHVGGAANDIGFVEQEDGTFGAIISDYDRSSNRCKQSKHTGKIRSYNQSWLDKLAQRYAYHKVTAELGDQGFYLEQEREENGEIFLEVTTPFGG